MTIYTFTSKKILANMTTRLLVLLILSFICCPTKGQIFDFNKIKSPVIFKGDYKFAYRDPAVIYHNNKFYLYFTLVERAVDSGMYYFTAYSISEDLVHWTYPSIFTPRDRTLNYSSPGNIIKYKDDWIICLQTYPTPNKERWGNESSRIWIMRSKDLISWSEPEMLKVKGNDIPVS